MVSYGRGLRSWVQSILHSCLLTIDDLGMSFPSKRQYTVLMLWWGLPDYAVSKQPSQLARLQYTCCSFCSQLPAINVLHARLSCKTLMRQSSHERKWLSNIYTNFFLMSTYQNRCNCPFSPSVVLQFVLLLVVVHSVVSFRRQRGIWRRPTSAWQRLAHCWITTRLKSCLPTPSCTK